MATPETWTGFLDDASRPRPGEVDPDPSPWVHERTVRDDDLPGLRGYRGDLRVVVTGGAGQVAGPGSFCRRHDLTLGSLDLTIRDLDDPAGNARRFVAAVDAAIDSGDVPEHAGVHVRVGGDPTGSWLLAADVLAEAEMVLAVPLDGADPAGWIDASMDREMQVSLVGGSVTDAVEALTTTARLWGEETDLVRARRFCRCWVTDDVAAALAHLEAT